MKILIIAATDFELHSTQLFLNNIGSTKYINHWIINKHEFEILITGAGAYATQYALLKKLSTSTYDLIIQAGLGGSYQKEKKLGSVFYIQSEIFGDYEIEEKDGNFTSMYQQPWFKEPNSPFMEGILINPDKDKVYFLPLANGITRNTVTGTNENAKKILNRHSNIEIENMEGASFFYVCLKEKIPFMSIRSISNYVEDRNKENWKMEEALNTLNEVLIGFIQVLVE